MWKETVSGRTCRHWCTNLELLTRLPSLSRSTVDKTTNIKDSKSVMVCQTVIANYLRLGAHKQAGAVVQSCSLKSCDMILGLAWLLQNNWEFLDIYSIFFFCIPHWTRETDGDSTDRAGHLGHLLQSFVLYWHWIVPMLKYYHVTNNPVLRTSVSLGD